MSRPRKYKNNTRTGSPARNAMLLWLLLVGGCAVSPTPPVQPSAPYYSVEFAVEATRAAALARLSTLDGIEHLRVEGRSSGWYVRAGAWDNAGPAEDARIAHQAQRVLKIEQPVPWLLSSGALVAVAARPSAAPTADKRAGSAGSPRQPQPPYYSIEFGSAASREAAVARLVELAGTLDRVELLRAERRDAGWVIRAGAWDRLEAAERALVASKGVAERALRIGDSVPWVLPNGTAVAPAAD